MRQANTPNPGSDRKPADSLDPVAALEAAIRREQEEEPTKGSSLDRDAIRGAARQTLAERLKTAEPVIGDVDGSGKVTPKPAYVATIKTYGIVIDGSIGRLDTLMISHPSTTRANQRFSPAAHEATTATLKDFVVVRGRVEKRLGKSELDEAIKGLCSVGVQVGAEDPMDVRDRSMRIVQTLESAEYAPRLAERAIEVTPLLANLKGNLDLLVKEIGRGTALTRGESADLIDKELVFLEIALERLFAFMEDHGAGTIAAAMQGLVPRAFARRAEDKLSKEEKAAKKAAEKAQKAVEEAAAAAKRVEELKKAGEAKKGEPAKQETPKGEGAKTSDENPE